MMGMKRKTTCLVFCVLFFSLLVRSVPGQQPTQEETHKRIRLWQLYYKLQDGTVLTSDEKKLFQQYHNDPNTIYYELHGIYPKSPILPPTPTPPKQPTRDELLSQIQNLKDAITTLEREIVRYQRWIAKLKHTIAERDQEISDLKLKLSRSEQRGTPSPRKPITQSPSSTPTSQEPSTPLQPQDVLSCLPKKTCAEISSCDEALYRLNVCGDKALDPDNDGIPCEDICQGQRQNPSESQKTTPTR
jgi:hypothetical protein